MSAIFQMNIESGSCAWQHTPLHLTYILHGNSPWLGTVKQQQRQLVVTVYFRWYTAMPGDSALAMGFRLIQNVINSKFSA